MTDIAKLIKNCKWDDGHGFFYVLAGDVSVDAGEIMLIDPCTVIDGKITLDNYEDTDKGYVKICTGSDGNFNVWEVYFLDKKIQTDNVPLEYRISIKSQLDNFYSSHQLNNDELRIFFNY